MDLGSCCGCDGVSGLGVREREQVRFGALGVVAPVVDRSVDNALLCIDQRVGAYVQLEFIIGKGRQFEKLCEHRDVVTGQVYAVFCGVKCIFRFIYGLDEGCGRSARLEDDLRLSLSAVVFRSRQASCRRRRV